MESSYFRTEFIVAEPIHDWPLRFFIISAYATTGEHWTEHENQRAHHALEHCLRMKNCWKAQVTCFSPANVREEPAWACKLSLEEARIVGLTFRQDAIFYVDNDQLYVTHCDERRDLVAVGSFRSRLQVLA